jgi:predicted HNH restriction endonuclease
LIRGSKARFKELKGRLFCEACGFDFMAVYGEDYTECHHTIPVHRLPSNGFTCIEDVALLCSNCHRMIHRHKEWMSVGQLISLLATPPHRG